jgi:NADH-quinone oxidoreductase subunit C
VTEKEKRDPASSRETGETSSVEMNRQNADKGQDESPQEPEAQGKSKTPSQDGKQKNEESERSSVKRDDSVKPPSDSPQSPEKQEAEGETKAEEAKPKAPRPAAAGRARPAAGARNRPAAKKEEEKPPEPSPLEPVLNRFVEIIKEKAGADAIEEAYVNRAGRHLPTLVIKRESWLAVAELLKEDPELSFDYVRNLSGVDYETHMEVVYHLYSFAHSHQIGIRVKTDREESRMPSVQHLWRAANWNEREIYDLLGIHFEGHPNLKRILMPDDWVGHPLRKDYEPLDKEV